MFYGNIVENDKMEPKRKHKDGPRSSEAFFSLVPFSDADLQPLFSSLPFNNQWQNNHSRRQALLYV